MQTSVDSGSNATGWTVVAGELAGFMADLSIGVTLIRDDGSIAAKNKVAASLLSGSIGRDIEPFVKRLREQHEACGAQVEATVFHPAGDVRIVLDRAVHFPGFVATLERQIEQRLAKEVSSLRSMMHASLSTAPATQPVALAATQLSASMASATVRIYERRSPGERLVSTFASGPHLDLPPELALPAPGQPARSAVAHAVTSGTIVHLGTASPLVFPDDRPIRSSRPGIALAFPLSCGGVTLGGLLVAIPQERLADDQLRLLLGFCDTAAVLLERAHSTEQLSSLGQQIASRERLTALGRLMSGLLHEINNPLCGLVLNLTLMDGTIEALGIEDGVSTEAKRDELQAMMVDVRAMIERLTAVVATVRGSGHLGMSFDTVFDPGHVVRDAVGLFSTARRRCSVSLCIPERLPSVRGRPSQLGEVILNLLENAFEAVPGEPQIRLDVEATETGLRLCVSDNGPGISAEHRPHLFEPGFSTKPGLPGAGLGLWICRNIVTSMNGTIDFRSSADGTTVVVEIPRAQHRGETRCAEPATQAS